MNPPEPPPNVIKDQEEWEVKVILKERQVGQQTEYLVSWKGYANSENKWLPEANLKHALDILKKYKD